MRGIHSPPVDCRENNPTRKVRASFGSDAVLGGWRRCPVKPAEAARRNEIAGATGAIESVLPKDKCPNRMRANAMKMTAIQAMSMISAVAMIGFPATAHAGGPPNPAPSPSPSPAPAQNYQFQNSAGNVSCNLSSGGAACEISNRAYTISTPPPPCAQHSAWGDRFALSSSGVTIDCHNDTLHVQGEQVLADGQTLSSGTFSCTAEPSAMKCTDSSSGHFFYMSPGSYQIG
jgi:hypothetical protein